MRCRQLPAFVVSLQEIVTERLMPLAREDLTPVVAERNAAGHALRLADSAPDSASYNDERGDVIRGSLRRAVGLVISAGYADMVTEEEVINHAASLITGLCAEEGLRSGRRRLEWLRAGQVPVFLGAIRTARAAGRWRC